MTGPGWYVSLRIQEASARPAKTGSFPAATEATLMISFSFSVFNFGFSALQLFSYHLRLVINQSTENNTQRGLL